MSRHGGLVHGRWNTGPDLIVWSGGAYLVAATLLALLHVDVTRFFDPAHLLPDRAFAAMTAWNPELDYLTGLYVCMLGLLVPVTACFVVHLHRRRTFLTRTEHREAGEHRVQLSGDCGAPARAARLRVPGRES